MRTGPGTVAVVIGFAEALSAPEVAWSLVDAGFEVIAFSRKGRGSALRHSRHVRVREITAPERDCTASLEDLSALLDAEAGKAWARTVLLPIDDASVWLCARVRPSTEWVLAGPGGACADFALDKRMQIEAAGAAGLNVPSSLFAATSEGLAERVSAYPVILRPANALTVAAGRLRKGRNWICSDAVELSQAQAAWNADDLLLMQPYLDGVSEGVFGIADETGVVAWSGHRRLRMMNPHGSGSSACISRVVPDALKAPITAMARACGWRGMFMVELLRTEDDKYWFVEFNGRAWGSMALSRRQSLEYPAWTVQLALDPRSVEIPAVDGKEDVVCRNLGREVMHLAFVLRGPQSRAIRHWPSTWGTLRALLRPRQGSTYYNWRREDWRVFFSDFWLTIRNQLFRSR